MRRFVSGMVCVWFFMGLAVAGDRPVVHRFALSNGLEVTVIPVQQNPVVSSTFVFNVGLKHETGKVNGVSHLLEHLTFNGTESRTQAEIYADIDRVGAYVNASTGDDYTAYYLLSPVETFDAAFQLQTDMLFQSTIPKDKIEKEKGIVLEEIRKSKVRPSFWEEQTIRSLIFPDTAYGLKVIGSEDSVTSISRAAILQFYKTFYVPSNACLLIVGDVKIPHLKKFLEQTVGKLESGKTGNQQAAVRMKTVPEPVFRKLKELNHPTVHYIQQGVVPGNPAYVAQDVAVQLLDDAVKRELADIDPNISLFTEVTSDYSLIHLKAQTDLETASNPETLRKRFLAVVRELQPDSDEIQRKATVNATALTFHLERPHFFGMMVAASLAAGEPITLHEDVPSVEAVQDALDQMAEPARSVLLVLQSDQEKGEARP